MEYIGNDVHQRESQVRISDEEGGQVLLERRVRTRGSGSRRYWRGGAGRDCSGTRPRSTAVRR